MTILIWEFLDFILRELDFRVPYVVSRELLALIFIFILLPAFKLLIFLQQLSQCFKLSFFIIIIFIFRLFNVQYALLIIKLLTVKVFFAILEQYVQLQAGLLPVSSIGHVFDFIVITIVFFIPTFFIIPILLTALLLIFRLATVHCQAWRPIPFQAFPSQA
jgi:hypothetical protein